MKTEIKMNDEHSYTLSYKDIFNKKGIYVSSYHHGVVWLVISTRTVIALGKENNSFAEHSIDTHFYDSFSFRRVESPASVTFSV